MENPMSTNVLILGAAGQIAGFAINLFLEKPDVTAIFTKIAS